MTSYSYDPAGNRTVQDAPAAMTYYAWDARGRLAAVEPVAGTVTLAYDAQSRRLGKQTPTQNTRYVYDFEKVLQETDGSGVTQNQYTSTEEQYGDLVSAYGGGQGSYYAFDALGQRRRPAGRQRIADRPLRLPGLRLGHATRRRQLSTTVPSWAAGVSVGPGDGAVRLGHEPL